MRFVSIILLSMGILLLNNISFAEKKDPISSIQNMVDGILEELATALNKNKQLSKEKEELAQANQALQTEISECKETTSSAFKLQENLDNCQTKLTQSESKIKESDGKIYELEQKIQIKEEEIEKLKNALVSKEKPLENYKVLLVQAENKVDELIRQREAQKDKLFKSFYEIGRTHTTEKRYKEAVASFEECVTIKPEDANAHYNLGILYQYVYGDRKGAIYHLKKYLELNPKVKDREEVELLLKVLEK